MTRIIAVCKSKEKGTRKEPVAEGVLRQDYGLLDDAHADCCTHRQVSLLATESINKMRSLGFDVGVGDFAENLTTEGIDLVKRSLPDLQRATSVATSCLTKEQIDELKTITSKLRKWVLSSMS